jgi:hypothetical protein
VPVEIQQPRLKKRMPVKSAPPPPTAAPAAPDSPSSVAAAAAAELDTESDQFKAVVDALDKHLTSAECIDYRVKLIWAAQMGSTHSWRRRGSVLESGMHRGRMLVPSGIWFHCQLHLSEPLLGSPELSGKQDKDELQNHSALLVALRTQVQPATTIPEKTMELAIKEMLTRKDWKLFREKRKYIDATVIMIRAMLRDVSQAELKCKGKKQPTWLVRVLSGASPADGGHGCDDDDDDDDDDSDGKPLAPPACPAPQQPSGAQAAAGAASAAGSTDGAAGSGEPVLICRWDEELKVCLDLWAFRKTRTHKHTHTHILALSFYNPLWAKESKDVGRR